MLSYRVSRGTQAQVMESVVLAARALRAAGATRLMTLHDDRTMFVEGDAQSRGIGSASEEEHFEAWLKRVRAKGAGALQMMLLSAHQVPSHASGRAASPCCNPLPASCPATPPPTPTLLQIRHPTANSASYCYAAPNSATMPLP
jgi:hypothetical protein